MTCVDGTWKRHHRIKKASRGREGGREGVMNNDKKGMRLSTLNSLVKIPVSAFVFTSLCFF